MVTILTKTRNLKQANLIIFIIFTITIYLQCCFFHKTLTLPITNIQYPYMHILKFAIAIFLGSFIFIFQKKSWIILVSFLINLWGISNIIYQRANEMLIDIFTITMLNNMKGFWNSVILYIQPTDFLCLLTTIAVTITYILFKNSNKSPIFLLYIILALSIHIIGSELRMRTIPVYNQFITKKYYNPFSTKSGNFSCWDMFDNASYIRETSIIHFFILQTNNYLQQIIFPKKEKFSHEELELVNKFIKEPYKKTTPQTPLVILIVENLESWIISPDITPNLYNFIESENNILYTEKLICQTRKGTSADGQMIINTGLLPIETGATCYRFPHHTFPSLSKLYNNTSNIIPGNLTIWNQNHMNIAYNIKNSFTTTWDDKDVFKQYFQIYKQSDFCMILTMSTHSPFDTYAHKSDLELPQDISPYISNYIKSFNYTDKCIKQFLDLIETDSSLKNSTIVITSDHTVFPSNKRNELSDDCKKKNIDYAVEKDFCPLIIYSPNIHNKTIINDTAFQMDIYPTILHVIGCEDYYWQGFGINLLDTNSIKNRPISPNSAFNISDKLIQNNYFKSIETQIQ